VAGKTEITGKKTVAEEAKAVSEPGKR